MPLPREANRPKQGNREQGIGNREKKQGNREQKRGNREQGTGNSLPEETPLAPVELDAEMIADEGLRRSFLESAKKYFAGNEGRRT